jgi:GNAT superfamily N-acetyltransferase
MHGLSMRERQVGPYTLKLCAPEQIDESWAVEAQVWSPFNWEAAGSVGVDYFEDLHIVAEDDLGRLVATIDACPVDWDGAPETLPEGGWTEIVLAAREGFDGQPRFACALGASILPGIRGHGLSGELLKALRDQALALGYEGLLAPVRPSALWRMPHLSVEQYTDVRLPDGHHFDPWVRTHQRIGGRIIGTCPASAEFQASREDWERWAGMRLPDSGRVLISGAVGWLELEDGWGFLIEPSVWILHT